MNTGRRMFSKHDVNLPAIQDLLNNAKRNRGAPLSLHFCFVQQILNKSSNEGITVLFPTCPHSHYYRTHVQKDLKWQICVCSPQQKRVGRIK